MADGALRSGGIVALGRVGSEAARTLEASAAEEATRLRGYAVEMRAHLLFGFWLPSTIHEIPGLCLSMARCS